MTGTRGNLTRLLAGVISCMLILLPEGHANSPERQRVVQPIITTTPDLSWNPAPLDDDIPADSRYIDFENGDDKNKGTRGKPWKHHPWDKRATHHARQPGDVRHYVFKRGITYRGTLQANQSGSLTKPVVLTSSSRWGTGKAIISASISLQGGWVKCKGKARNQLPPESSDMTWCRDMETGKEPRLLWSVDDQQINRIPLAREPNWLTSNPDDPRSEWPELTSVIAETEIPPDDNSNITPKTKNKPVQKNNTGSIHPRKLVRRLIDSVNLGSNASNFYTDATIWVEKKHLPRPVAAKVISSEPDEASVSAILNLGLNRGPGVHSRYFLEGLPQFLDTQNEFYFEKLGRNRGRIYLRLPGDKNPNGIRIEAAQETNILTLNGHSNIEISGLTFRHTNQLEIGTRDARHAYLYSSAIQVRGNTSGILIRNNEFQYLTNGIVVHPDSGTDAEIIDNITISDNDFLDIDGSAILMGNGNDFVTYRGSGTRLKTVSVLRNRINNTGYRAITHGGLGANGHGININGAEIVEVAGNDIDTVWGSGITVTLASEFERSGLQYPLLRGQIHHNKIVNTVLGMQDIGGIEAWLGGPIYIYNNISGNPVGYSNWKAKNPELRKTFRKNSYGIGIYLDSQYKAYIFNNIAWGKNNNINDPIYNAAAFNEAAGFMHTVFHNTLYNYAVGLHKGGHQHNRSYYLGNLFLDIGHAFIQQEPHTETIDYQTLAFSNNLFSGTPKQFGQLGRQSSFIQPSLEKWKKTLSQSSLLADNTGTSATRPAVLAMEEYDFRPAPESEAIDRGVKVFVPWALSRVVGEWNFFRHTMDPGTVQGENMNMNNEWVSRRMFHDIPRNNLTCHNIRTEDYRPGILEDWIRGALSLNGRNQYCEITPEELEAAYTWEKRKKKNLRKKDLAEGSRKSGSRDTVDMDTNNFILEIVLKTEKPGPLITKHDGAGYTLEVNRNGNIELSLTFGKSTYRRSSSIRVNDGAWHHVLAEINRDTGDGVNLYIDGILKNGEWQGEMEPGVSLSNQAPFLVGHRGNEYFQGKIDFIRISKGNLADAKTDINELYEWQFSGPFLMDFSGKSPVGKKRDIGAVELAR